MIINLELTNFKCFKKTTRFNFSKLNLLTGINGRGKSSVLQSLLLLAQTVNISEKVNNLKINGSFIELGNFDDIKNSDTVKGEKIKFKLQYDTTSIRDVELYYKEDLIKPLIAVLDKLILDGEELFNYGSVDAVKKLEQIKKFTERCQKLHYVGADRLGPVKYVDKEDLPDFSHVGAKGEYCINVLANSIDYENVDESLYLGDDANSLIQQTIEWMNYILEGAKINIKGKEQDSSVLYMMINNKNDNHEYKPINVGFGYSYILPLVVTGLMAKKDEVIIIENPEAHLHPRAQSKIAEFFARVAATGVQVFIESHSEHILNGMRLGSLNPEINLNNNELKVHYFNEDFESVLLDINEKGKINNWPYGFFDQQEIDLAEIFKYSR